MIGSAWPSGSGELARLIRSHDWASTPVGPLGSWPQSLKAVVDLVLGSPMAMIVLWGPDLIQIYNDAYRALMADKHPSGLGESTHACWPEARQFTAPIYDAIFRGEARSLRDQQLTLVRYGVPEPAWFHLNYSPLRDGARIVGVLAAVVETTDRVRAERERKRAEEALRESEERYRTLFVSMGEGFCVIDRMAGAEGEPADFRYAVANPAFAKQTGLAGVVGRTIREVVPGEADEWIAIYDGILETGEPQRFERLLAAKGRVLELYAFRVEDETRGRVAVIFSDVTERKQTEEALRGADRRKDEFIATLGHELRNPLAPLSTGLEVLRRARSQPELVDDVRAMMGRQVDHLTRLVDDLLDVTRIGRGHAYLQRAPLDLAGAITAAIEQSGPLIDERRHELVVQLPDTPLPIHGDVQRLIQVIGNLLSNAARYSGPGGTITLQAEKSEKEVLLRVADTGYGIPPERLGHLFRMFSQMPEHRALTGGGGLGIGLALSRQLVELHGGSIEARSEGIGHGSEFLVRLPLAAPASDVEPKRSPPSTGAEGTRRRRVLVIDDNVDAAETLRAVLEAYGHEVRAVNDGFAALETMKWFRPEVLLLDIGLPRMDGYEVARRARVMPGGPHVLLVAVTGWGQDEDERRAREAGFDEHLTKPIDMEKLRSLLLAEAANL